MRETSLFGVYRAVVEAHDDEQTRHRYRVRVVPYHPAEIPVDCLPWAELNASYAGKGSGDVPHFENGDRVFVGFLGGNVSQPVILGGSPCKGGGVLDGSVGVACDWENTRQRWRREDHEGNTVELSEHPREVRVLLRSGDAEVSLSKADGTLTMRTAGVAELSGSKLLLAALQMLVQAQTINMAAMATTAGIPLGDVRVQANREINLDVPLTANPGGKIRIGGRLAAMGDGVAVTQTYLLQLLAQVCEVGIKGDSQLADTLVAKVRAAQQVLLEAGVDLDLTSGNAVTIRATGGISAEGQAVSVKATKGAMTLEAVGGITVKSQAEVTVEAPQVTIKSPKVEVLNA